MASYTRIIAILCKSKEERENLLPRSMPNLKRVKVLTHRPKRAETAEVSKPAEGSSASGSDCPALVGAREKLAKVSKPKVITEQQKAETTEVLKRPAEARAKTAEEPKSKKLAEQPKILSPPQETELPKVIEISAITLKRRRMASVFVSVSTRGVSGPTSKLSLRVPAQMGRRETEHKGEQ